MFLRSSSPSEEEHLPEHEGLAVGVVIVKVMAITMLKCLQPPKHSIQYKLYILFILFPIPYFRRYSVAAHPYSQCMLCSYHIERITHVHRVLRLYSTPRCTRIIHTSCSYHTMITLVLGCSVDRVTDSRHITYLAFYRYGSLISPFRGGNILGAVYHSSVEFCESHIHTRRYSICRKYALKS